MIDVHISTVEKGFTNSFRVNTRCPLFYSVKNAIHEMRTRSYDDFLMEIFEEGKEK